ncbi:MAG TPA: MFS transporter [Acidimicrobiia bacterium]|nr:MFS transporter [Acidimicrobiia bacterium]
MAKPMLVRLAAPPGVVRDLVVARLAAATTAEGALAVAAPPDRQPAIELTLSISGDAHGTTVAITSTGGIDVPFFAWFFRPLVAIAHRRARAHAAATLEAALAGRPDPPPPGPLVGLPPVAFTHEQSTLLATASAASAVVGFAGALFGQLNSPISHSFHASDADIGVALAVTRFGALIALFAIALADRRGRRRAILFGVIGSAVVCAVSALAPNLTIFTAAQVFQRGFVITTFVVAGIAVVEEAPEGARAFAASMLALAGGLGFAISVVVLPFGDVQSWGWRIPFAVGAASILLVPAIARRLAETTRYLALAERSDVTRGRVRDVVERHGRRFVLLALVAFLTSIFSAPSSQFMNKYLTDDHGFTNTGIAIFRTVTTGIPGLVGLLLGGRLAEARGRRPVAALALAIATASQMVFFLAGGPIIWLMSAVSILAAGASGVALGTMDAELFPTEVRSTSNALLVVVGVLGSATGLVLSGALSDPLGGLGRAVALMGVGSLVVAIFIVPLLPESAARALDDVSPTWPTEGDYGPDP